MYKLAVPQERDCWTCFNTENNITLTTVNFTTLLNNCATNLDFKIITKSLENQTSVACCSYCYESAQHLTLVKEQIVRLQKEVSDSSLLFAQNILQRRNRVKIGKDRSAKPLTSPTDISFAIHKNPDPHSIIVIENLTMNKECIESWSKELPSEEFQENSEVVELVTDPLLNADEHVHLVEDQCNIDIHSGDDIDSYGETVSNAFDTAKIKIVSNRLSATSEHYAQPTVETSVTDVLKCLNLPINELENIQHCIGGRSPKTVAAAGEETVKSEKSLDENKPYNCSSCGQGFIGMGDLEDHDKLHNKKRLYACSFCDKSFLKPHSLKVQENIHSGEPPRPYKCLFCGKSFLRSSNLKQHETIHSEEKPYQCSCCSKSFRKSQHLRDHESIHSGEKPYTCSFCSRSFRLPRILKSHEATHSGEKPYKCYICSRSFRLPHLLKLHATIHSSGERPHKCSFCDKSFPVPSALKTHEGVHTGKRPFNCSSCSKSFTRLNILRNHEAIHSGKKPHKCSSCVKSFTSKFLLKSHERSHTGDRPFNCSFCSKSFTTSSALNRHKKVHTGERPYKCPNCKECFQRKYALTSHFQLKHGQIKEEFILP